MRDFKLLGLMPTTRGCELLNKGQGTTVTTDMDGVYDKSLIRKCHDLEILWCG